MAGGLQHIPDGQIATIVTSLQMLSPPPRRPLPDGPLRLERWPAPALDRYRMLFRRVGEPWLWFSRLVMPDKTVTAIIHDPAVEVYAVRDPRGIEVGMLELDLRTAGTCEIGYLGLVPELTGKRLGDWLMAHALTLGWRSGMTRLWVHTCTLDHPGALGFYRRHGFVPFAREVEIFADPRLSGVLPADAAPQVPLLGRGSSR